MDLIIQIAVLTGSATKCRTVSGLITPLSSLEWAHKSFRDILNPAIQEPNNE